MQTGGMMPCNDVKQTFVAETKEGGRIFNGYVPHWATCPDAKRFKKG